MKKVVLGAVILLFGLLFAACGGTENDSDGKVSDRFYISDSASSDSLSEVGSGLETDSDLSENTSSGQPEESDDDKKDSADSSDGSSDGGLKPGLDSESGYGPIV